MKRHPTTTSIALRSLLALCLPLAALPASANREATETQQREWDFNVFLDERPIGRHTFEVIDDGSQRIVRSDARFDVDILFFNAYRYRHLNRESWNDGCLHSIEARTDENDKTQTVVGNRAGEAFRLQSSEKGDAVLPGCVMSFAYWDPRILRQKQLLNSQTGEYMPVEVTPMGSDVVNVQGRRIDAERYRLVTTGIVIDLWYTPDQQWLALESRLESGDRLRYVAERAPIR
jgi:hypothetical protein